MAGSVDQDDEVISQINVTPLVDVMLVLLVIFMVAAPVLYQSAIKVQLPKAQTGDQAEKSPVEFTLTRSGELLWGKEKMDWAKLETKLKSMGAQTSEMTAIISADEATPHGQVIRLMDLLRKVGLSRFALNVDSSS